jgi:hypothetical protein
MTTTRNAFAILALLAAPLMGQAVPDAQPQFQAVQAVASPPPGLIDFQARLSDNVGNPLVGPVTVTARLYDVPTGGSSLWVEVHNITALAGVVNVQFGSLNVMPPDLFEAGELYLAIQIGADPEMQPRRRLASVPYSLRASRLERLDGSTTIDPDVIARDHIQADAIDSARLENGEVRNEDLAIDSVDSSRISNGSVALADMGADAVDSGVICDASVALADMATDAVDSGVICDASVALADMGLDAVDTGVICDGSIALLDMGADAVDGAVICDGSVGLLDMGLDAVDSGVICDASIALTDMGTDAVDSGVICDASVALADMAADAVDSSVICDGSVGLTDLDPFGATAGQVLKYDGVTLSWEADIAGALNLPFTASDAGAENAFEVTTTNPGGTALAGIGSSVSTSTGVLGLVSGQEGSVGVMGYAESPSADRVYGVEGVTTSPHEDAAGVRGSGPRSGVEGALDLGGGSGAVWARLGDHNGFGTASGLRAEAFSDEHGFLRGVHASADSTQATQSIGLYGRAYRATLSSIGAFTQADAQGTATSAHGIWAEGQESTGTNCGVHAEATSYNLSSNVNYGVYSFVAGTSGVSYGVYAQADQSTQNYGLYARGWQGNGYGVYGEGLLYGVFSKGNTGATGTKAFVHPHPTDPGKEIRYVSLEGPEAGTYFRGSGELDGGVAVVEVPESFRLVSEPEGLTVQLTAVGGPCMLWVESQGLDRIVVRGEPDASFHYLVNGVRQGFADHEPIVDNSAYVPLYRGERFGDTLAPAQQQRLVANGILNADLTPNEATAARLGWTLHEPDHHRDDIAGER